MRSIEVVGKNIEEAIEEGLKKLDLTQTDVDIKIISKGGWFSKAKVLITETVENESKTNLDTVKKDEKLENNYENKEETVKKEPIFAKEDKKSDEYLFIKKNKIASESILDGSKKSEKTLKEEKKDDFIHFDTANDAERQKEQIGIIQNFLDNFLKQINIEAKIEVQNTEKAIIFEIKTETANLLIGHRGENMQALQSIINSILKVNNYTREDKRILIDVENYMDNQVKKIEEKAKRAIERCLETSKPVSLDFMNSYERYIVHDIVVQDGRVTSESIGNEPRRFVKIFIK